MSMDVITRESYAHRLGVVGGDGEISRRALAGLLRAPLERWGLSPRSAILRHVREQLEATGVRDRASVMVTEILNSLVRLGDCVEAHTGQERYIAPALPRWVPTGEGTGALLGAAPVPADIDELPSVNGRDLVRRIRVQGNDDLATLHMADIRETSIGEWLRPVEYLRHATRRKGRVLRNDEISLSQFWELLETTLADDGLPLGDEAEVRAVTGEPGTFFGRYHAEFCEGRWSDSAPNGVWCAYRRGYGAAHWHPILLSVNGDERRSMDLFDMDEWRWALLGRARRFGLDEQVERIDGEIRLKFPVPRQLAAAMDILGPRRAPWSWVIGSGAPDPWSELVE